jgi:membrane dipeptidase
MKRIAAVFVLLVAAAAVVFFGMAPSLAEKRMNAVVGHARPVSPASRALHDTLRVADLHADSLLWGRDLLVRGARGHLDLPRLVDGGVALQVLDVVTKSPRNLNIERNDDKSDNITALAVAQRWPPKTWTSLEARALYQAERLEKFSARSDGKLRFVKTRAALADALAAHEKDRGVVAVVLGLEGAQALGGDVGKVDEFFAAGYRVISPSHFFDTEFGGSAAGVVKGGLTDAGRAWVRAMEAHSMTVDLAHASPATIRDVLAMAKRPVIVSHGGLRGTCDNRRNLSDDEARGVAATGGIIGIGFWDVAVCGNDAAAIARAIVYAIKTVGLEHVALGSDFDGAVDTPFDAAGLAQLTDALRAAGLDDKSIARVMGENAIDFFSRALP